MTTTTYEQAMRQVHNRIAAENSFIEDKYLTEEQLKLRIEIKEQKRYNEDFMKKTYCDKVNHN